MKAAALSHCCLPATRVAMCLLALHLSIRERTCTNLILSNCMISLLGKPRSDVSSLSELPKLCDVTMISTEPLEAWYHFQASQEVLSCHPHFLQGYCWSLRLARPPDLQLIFSAALPLNILHLAIMANKHWSTNLSNPLLIVPAYTAGQLYISWQRFQKLIRDYVCSVVCQE